MLQCKRFHWEDEFNEWARKENIQRCYIVAIESLPPDSFMVFYDKNMNYYDYLTSTTTTTNNDKITITAKM